MTSPCQPILILGAGINGAALARELLLNHVPVVLVDTSDLSAGTTAYSSRLVHGGLRYLEYGEFALVRESLAERTRLLQLAPDFVRPLRLFIPASRRLGGLRSTLWRLITGREVPTVARGMWLVRIGLWLYDRYARDPLLPRHSLHSISDATTPAVDAGKFRWLCAYSDAQMLYPERLVVALLTDAQRAAKAAGVSFEVLTYHEATLHGRLAEVRPRGAGEPVKTWEPAAVVNATGAWVDETLRRLGVTEPNLMGGTKGSHFVTYHPVLRQALGDVGVYVEATDGRPIFLLPLDKGVLVGTTDIAFEGDPADAVATHEELQYLIDGANRVFPQAKLSPADIAFHYSGVRPLPAGGGGAPGAITRRHRVDEHADAPLPFFSLVGGKLTTCRSLAEQAAALILDRLELPRRANSRERAIPAGEAFMSDDAPEDSAERLDGTRLSKSTARRVIEEEWVTTLDDLVERRLMLLYQRVLTTTCLEQLTALLVEAGKLAPDAAHRAVADTVARLGSHFGKQVEP